MKLGVNVDHVATIRQARLGVEPSPIDAAIECENVGAWGITAHLREDRRHIIDSDIITLAKTVKNLNMEMAVTDEMVKIACEVKPHSSCLVPEKREELTTEGGLDVVKNYDKIKAAIEKLHANGILVSLFIDPVTEQIQAASDLGSDYIELHTGTYANHTEVEPKQEELNRLIAGAKFAHSLGLKVNAGHGIDYVNIEGILQIPHLQELNIGHSIVSRAVFVGISKATAEMVELMKAYKL